MTEGKRGHVSYNYRSGGGSGTVVRDIPGKGTKKDPMLEIRPDKASRHPGEPGLLHRLSSNVRKD